MFAVSLWLVKMLCFVCSVQRPASSGNGLSIYRAIMDATIYRLSNAKTAFLKELMLLRHGFLVLPSEASPNFEQLNDIVETTCTS